MRPACSLPAASSNSTRPALLRLSSQQPTTTHSLSPPSLNPFQPSRNNPSGAFPTRSRPFKLEAPHARCNGVAIHSRPPA